MKRYSLFIFLVFFLWGAVCPFPLPAEEKVGYIDNISFDSSLPGKERVIISLSHLGSATVEKTGPRAVLVKVENTFVPQDFRRPMGEGIFKNLIRLTATQKVIDARQWAYLLIDLKEPVPYSVRQEGQNIYVDFNTGGLAKGPDEKATVPKGPEPRAAEEKREELPSTPQKVSLDFQDASIKSVLRLLAELGGVNIVSGEDVKGNVTVQLKNVPWDQALETILSITGLTKRQEGNVITVMTLERWKKDEADRQAALEAKRKVEAERLRPPEEPFITRIVSIDYADAKKLMENLIDLLPKDKDGKPMGSVKVDEHSNSLIIQARKEDMVRLFPIIAKIDKPTPQILIKANIVETTKDTARNLGIQWGGMYGHTLGGQALYITPGGTGGSALSPTGPFAGSYTAASGVKGIAGQGFGINFPVQGTTTASASLGLIFGTIGSNVLELQLTALQKDGKLRILSSPSITTLDNQKAFTENGEKIPYVTTETTGGTISKVVKFENAVLRLEITPHVIDGKNLKMKILVQKDEVDPSRNVDGNPYIIKKQTETNLIVQDGETIVISGLTKQKNLESISGVPWLKDIPILGWLFKGEGKSESMEEVLIFITPSILKPQAIAGIQEGP